jgi:glucose/arabinose dehydrogenase
MPPPPPPPPPPSADTTPPTAGILSPSDFATGLTGSFTVTGTGLDDVGVTSIQFQVDGVSLGTDTTSPFSMTVDANAYAPGQHIISVRAADAANNQSAWKSITVKMAGTNTVDTGFTKDESWVTGLASTTAMAQAPDGRIFVAEQTGKLRVIKGGVLQSTAFHTFTVDSSGERGLLGVAFHPNFTINGWVYVYYTTPSGGAHNRISRLTASGSNADVSTGAEDVLVDLPALSGATNHNGGAIHFGSDGKLYAGVGENANSANAQDLNTPLGKMLRFNDDGSIPNDNPFCTTAATLKCAVWAYGLRNPFTFAVQPGTGTIYINDVGQGTWEEIDVGTAGRNFGWPSSEGPDNTTGFTAPLFAYKHSDASPAGSGPGGFFTGFAIAGGAFYPSSGPFPASYRGNYFFADYISKWVARLDPANSNAAYAFAKIAGNPVDMIVGSDGALYVLAEGGSITRITAP